MEIIITGKQYQHLVSSSVTSKKMIFYNEDNDIFIYQNGDELWLPKVETKKEEEFFSEIYKMTGIRFQQNDVEQFLQLQDNLMELKKQNNKLKKIYLKNIRDYYSCLVPLDRKIQEKMNPREIREGIFYPKVVSLDDLLTIKNQKEERYYSHTNESLKIFKRKIKERGHAGKKV